LSTCSQLNGHLEKLWKLAERPASIAKVKGSISVTDTFEATTLFGNSFI